MEISRKPIIQINLPLLFHCSMACIYLINHGVMPYNIELAKTHLTLGRPWQILTVYILKALGGKQH